jgi:hypothetical protein
MEITQTLELLESIKSLLDEIEIDSEDGKLTVFEILGDYPEILGVIEQGKDFAEIKKELQNLDLAEIQQLTTKLIEIVGIILQIVQNLKK